MTVLFKILQVILAFSVLIILHEFGHFTFAKIFGIRVEKFFLFFDIGGRKLCSFHIGDTEFGIGWLPFGGYCKIAGMIDESLDTAQMKRNPQLWEFRTKPAWQRLLVMAGGVLYNFIFAILAYSLILGIWGDGYYSNEGAFIRTDALSEDLGFRTGDHIISLDDYVPRDFGMMQADIVRRSVREATVLRGSDTLQIWLDQSKFGSVLNDATFFGLALPFVIDSIPAGTANAGILERGDSVTAIAGTPIRFLHEASAVLADHRGSAVPVSIVRSGEMLEKSLQVDSLGRIGIYVVPPVVKYKTYNFLSSIPAGWKKTWSTVGGYLRDLKLVATPSTGAYKSVGSFIAVGQVFPDKWDWFQFLTILALLSIMLAVMNLLPIPGLDGGHIFFTLFEMITGRKPSDRFLYVAQMIGMLLLVALMLLAFGNDIGRLIH